MQLWADWTLAVQLWADWTLAAYLWADWTLPVRLDPARITGPRPCDWTLPVKMRPSPLRSCSCASLVVILLGELRTAILLVGAPGSNSACGELLAAILLLGSLPGRNSACGSRIVEIR